MSQLQTLTPTYVPPVKPQIRRKPPVRAEAPAALYHCLIVSTSPERGAMFRQAASEQGWEPLLCDTAEQASREVVRHRLQMVIVDLDTAGDGAPEHFRELAERLAGDSGRLLLVCGNERDVTEEIWARQLGAWMYLPGVDDQSDVAMLCGEAKNVAEKLVGRPTEPITTT